MALFGNVRKTELRDHFAKASKEFSTFVASVLNKGSISVRDREAIHERAKEEKISIAAIDVFLKTQLEEVLTYRAEYEERKKTEKQDREEGIIYYFSTTLKKNSTEILSIDIDSVEKAENLNHLLILITQQLISNICKEPNIETSIQREVLIQKYGECVNLIKLKYPNDARFSSIRSKEEMENYLVERQKILKEQAEEYNQRRKEEQDKIIAVIKKYTKKYGLYVVLFYIILAAIVIIFIT